MGSTRDEAKRNIEESEYPQSAATLVDLQERPEKLKVPN